MGIVKAILTVLGVESITWTRKEEVIAARHIAEVVTIIAADSSVGAPESVPRAGRGFIRRARNVAVTLRRDEHLGDNSQQPKLTPCETI